MRKSKFLESIRKDAHETSHKLYNKLIDLEGLKPAKNLEEAGDGGDFTIEDEVTGIVFTIGQYDNYNDGNHWNLWISPNRAFYDKDLRVTNYLQLNLTEKDILDFCDDLYDEGAFVALKNAGFDVRRKDSDYRENYDVESLQEALGNERFSKIRNLITECKKEGFGVSISIPKKTLNK